jgi:hypothetical protein
VRLAWLAMTASQTAPNSYTGTIYRTRGPAYNATEFDASKVTETRAGSGTLTFRDRSNGAFSYAVDGASWTTGITRQIFATPPAVCN